MSGRWIGHFYCNNIFYNLILCVYAIIYLISKDSTGTKTDGIYSLERSIEEELTKGISNFDYGKFFPPLLKGNFNLNLLYCDSNCNTLIRASDILANRVWVSYVTDNENLRTLPKHIHRKFP